MVEEGFTSAKSHQPMEDLVKSLPSDRDEEQLKTVSDEMKPLLQSLDTHKYEINKNLNEFKEFLNEIKELLNEFKTSLDAQIKATGLSTAYSETMMTKWKIFHSEVTAEMDAMSAKVNDQIQKIQQLHDRESVRIRNLIRELRIDVTDVSTNYVKKNDNDENQKDLKQQQKRLEQEVRISLNDSSRSNQEQSEKVEEKLKLLEEQNQEQEEKLKLLTEQNQEQEEKLKLLKEQHEEKLKLLKDQNHKQENTISTLQKMVIKHENKFQTQDRRLEDVIAAGKS